MRKQLLTILLLLLLPALAVAQSGDYKKYIDAAQKGDAEAQYQVATSLRDSDESLAWLRKAAREQGAADVGRLVRLPDQVGQARIV